MSAHEGSKWQEENERRKSNEEIVKRVTATVKRISKEVEDESKTGLQKLLDSLVNQSNGCGQSSERYILSGIISYTKELIEEENALNNKLKNAE